MKIALETRWVLAGNSLDSRVLPLLRAIARTGSLAQARSAIHLSYRQAWTMLGTLAERLGEPLVQLQQGRGAALSALGTALVAADTAAHDVLARPHQRIVQGFETTVARLGQARSPTRITIHASHDLALSALRERLRREKGVELDLHFQGSLEALDALLDGHCEIAGFHVPKGPLAHDVHSAFDKRLLRDDLAIVQFVARCQGLMMARGNPRHIRRIADLAQRGVRFINRQEGSGTRLLFDAMLADAGVPASRIAGYAVEEFTHAAVAATVASGMADAGFGIEAAARQAGLAFVPLADERYYLALSKTTLARPPVQQLLASLRGTVFRALLKKLPGYNAAGAGRQISARTLLAGKKP